MARAQFSAERVFAHPRYQALRKHGYSVTAAFLGVKRHEHFCATLKKDIAEHKRRSSAAKKAWKARKAKP